MKYLCVVFYLVSYLSYAQVNQFQIELVDENIGASLSDPPNFYTNQSNDDGLNQIFQSYNVSHYEVFYPDYPLPEPYLSQPARFNFGLCECDVDALLNELNAYSSVVKYASYNQNQSITNNVLVLALVNSTVGVPIGYNGEVVITNDAGLNTIFSDYNVRTFGIGLPPNDYGLVCSCDAEALKAELDNYDTVISETFFSTANFLLSIEDKPIEDLSITPNPFYDQIKINTNAQLESLVLYDVLGKMVLSTTSIPDFESYAQQLKSGVYLLRLTDLNDNTVTKKIIKQ